MKSSVEQLSPTRVRISVEVPFTELEPDFQRAYKELAKQVRMPGFRPGKAPVKLLEARFGRHAMLDQVVNEALPARYGQAVAETEVQPLGTPDIEVTKKEYGEELAFTAEVDVRPKIDLPDLSALKVEVDPIQVTGDDVENELQALRTRFGSLNVVDRPAADGDVVSIDLSATVEGEPVSNATAEGLTHEVGSGRLIEGLDDALVGLSVDESKEFAAKLATGEHAGEDAQVTVTVRSVKERELPEPDDEFAQLASEFDTIEELRTDLRDQVGRVKRLQQAEKIQAATIEALIEQVDVPVPEAIVQAELDSALRNALHGLDHDEGRLAEVLAGQGTSREEFEADARGTAEKNVKRQLLLDALADDLEVQVGQDDLSERLLVMSRQYGVEPQQLFGYLQEQNQLPSLFADVRRGLAIAAAVEAATVTDGAGNIVDTSEFFGKRGQTPEDEAEREGVEDTDKSDDSADSGSGENHEAQAPGGAGEAAE